MANRIKRIKDTPTLHRLTADPRAKTVVVPVHAVVVDGENGPKTLKQKIQSAYKAITAGVGSLAASLIAAEGIPGLPDQYKGWFAGAAVGLTVLGVILVKNQEFVENL